MINTKGFALMGLVLVIIILGILGIVSLPKMFAISPARPNSPDASVNAIQAGLYMYAKEQAYGGNEKSYPTLLETTDLADGTIASPTSPLFTAVLSHGVTKLWFKVDDDCYAYDTNGNSTFNDGIDEEFQYIGGTTGTFLGIADCGS